MSLVPLWLIANFTESLHPDFWWMASKSALKDGFAVSLFSNNESQKHSNTQKRKIRNMVKKQKMCQGKRKSYEEIYPAQNLQR